MVPRPIRAAKKIEVWLTTPDATVLLAPQPALTFGAVEASPLTIEVDDTRIFQSMEGFGAALTESSAWLMMRLEPARREILLKALFDPREGIGLSYLRVPMGASDFALDSYTYDDRPRGETDPELRHFSIARDRKTILPILKRAKALNPELKIVATPWSAPAWMKTSEALNSGKLRPDAYPAYARYFVRFLQAYQAEGVSVEALTIQNEPRHEPAGYPCMRMEPVEQAAFIRDHLGPALTQAGSKTQIWAWDHNWDGADYPLSVLNDPGARKYVAGSAFHCYDGAVEAQSRVHDAHPDKDIYFTECSGGAWANDFGGNLKWNMQNLVIGAPRHWAKTVLLWNLALDEKAGPQNGGCTNCRGVVTIPQKQDAIQKNVEYYVLGHASKFVRTGAKRIASNTFPGDLETVAYRNADGSCVLLVLNASTESRTFAVRWKGQGTPCTLPAGAVATLRWL